MGARTCWVNPNPPSGTITKSDMVFCSSTKAPAFSPAPAGNPIVPAGWVRQTGSNGDVDIAPVKVAGNFVPTFSQFVVPYFSGGWPADPVLGQPGHTAQRPTGAG